MSNSTQNEQLKKECYRPNRCDCEDCVLNREIWADDIVKRVTPKTTTRFCLICNQELEPRHVCKCPEHMKPSTQNDWAKEILFHLENLIVDIGTQVTDDYKEKNGLYEGMSIKNVRSRDKYKKIFTTLLADARKEVIRRIEAMPDKDVRPEITVWLESKEYCLGYNKALSNVLATLREEEGL